MSECVFCKIIEGKIPSRRLWEDESCIAIEDLNPQARTHLLIIPRKHLASLAAASDQDEALLGHLLATVAKVAREHNLESGYRTVINIGEDGGQTVAHLHVHLLGGRAMHWPPG